MKKLILILMSLISFNSFAQSLPWPDGVKCGRHVGMNIDGKLISNFTQYNWYAVAWKEVVDGMAILLNKPDLKLSFEYLQYRSGYQIMTAVDYSDDCFNFPEHDQEVLDLLALQEKRPLTSEDFKTPRWVHMVNAIDVEEVNCLAMSKVNGKYSGCGDIWQEGITEDEAVCYKGKNYLRCHVDCIQKIYDRKLDLEPGFCK